MLKLISPGRTLRSIGNSLPNCKLNHATVLHSIRQLDSLLSQDINYFTKFEEISKDVKELIKAKDYINLAENYFESDVNVDYEYKPLPKIFNKRGQNTNPAPTPQKAANIAPLKELINKFGQPSYIDNLSNNINLYLVPEELGGHSDVAVTCLLAGYTIILDYQKISSKGDMNSDGLVSLIDLALLSESILVENKITTFQWWAGDCDYDDQHSVIDLLMVANLWVLLMKIEF